MNLVNSRTGEEERTLTFQVGRMRRSRRWRARAFLSKMQRRIQVFWEERTWKWGLKTQRRKRGADDCRRKPRNWLPEAPQAGRADPGHTSSDHCRRLT